ncbi:MAG: germination protein YpeB [Eubacteriales bacterium]|nr:germination protein YpeB [Eubacteriales bacterium]
MKLTKKKTVILAATYISAAIIILGLFAAVCSQNLKKYRLASDFSAAQAFEETVAAVGSMSRTLAKTPYATDRDMCASLCSQVYADALAAEAAMSTLPFATHELEEISAYLNQTGDYAATLCRSVAEDGFSESERENMRKLSVLSSKLNESLSQLRQEFHNGALDMDSSEIRLMNVGTEQNGKISEGILQAESDFPRREALTYDGKYSFKSQPTGTGIHVSDAQMLAAAAKCAGLSPAQLTLNYSFEDGSGRKVYSAGDIQICVAPEGIVSMSSARLIEQGGIAEDDAKKAAESFVENMGYKNMLLTDTEATDTSARYTFISTQDDALCPDNYMTVTVALDNCSVYAFNAEHYSNEKCDVVWNVTEVEAAGAVPDVLEVQETRKVIIDSAGGKDTACFEFLCKNETGGDVTIRVNAATGKQADILL